ncbi:MAG: ChaN family lipoprotein, partial [Hyphomicrobiaceae bacterium]
MNSWRRYLAVALAFAALTPATHNATACTSEPPLAHIVEPWRSATHPLVGHLWRRDAPTEVTPCGPDAYRTLLSELDATLGAGGVVLLGEVHDNAEHHKLRGALLSDLASRLKDRPPALIFEHIRADQQTALDAVVTFDQTARRLATASDIFKAVDWSKSGWPDARLFAPLYTAALRSHAALIAGDPPRDKVKAVARQGLAALDASEAARLQLTTPLSPDAQDGLLTELEASHCGLMP